MAVMAMLYEGEKLGRDGKELLQLALLKVFNQQPAYLAVGACPKSCTS